MKRKMFAQTVLFIGFPLFFSFFFHSFLFLILLCHSYLIVIIHFINIVVSIVVQWMREHWDFDWKGRDQLLARCELLIRISLVCLFFHCCVVLCCVVLCCVVLCCVVLCCVVLCCVIKN
jgi:hypothetical protein